MMTTGLVLAGGRSRRMGQDKAWLPIAGEPLIHRVCRELHRICDEVIIATDDVRRFSMISDVLVRQDILPDQHALGGMYTGLTYASSDVCMVVACDMPFLNTALIRQLLTHATQYELVMPQTTHGLQPLHAVYTRACLPVIQQQLAQQRFDVQALVPLVRTWVVPPDQIRQTDPHERSFQNLNTPADYAAATSL